MARLNVLTDRPRLERERLLADFLAVRALTCALAAPLRPDDWRVQSMPDVSPPYWNLGHTSWFFARHVLHPAGRYDASFAKYEYALNSYYEGLGPRLPRARRGSVTSPATDEVLQYRDAVDARMRTLLADAAERELATFADAIAVGIQHEQQHQELFLTEILHIRANDPAELRVPYLAAGTATPAAPAARTEPHRRAAGGALRFAPVHGGLVEIGHDGAGFAWDNERSRHRAWVDDFAIATRLVTNAEWCAFVDDGGYRDPLLWLANGWTKVQEQGLQAPLYWERCPGGWTQWTLRGSCRLDPDAPVAHVGFYEADAFARWFAAQSREHATARLPTEREWEHVAGTLGFDTAGGNLLDGASDSVLRPLPARGDAGALQQAAGDLWEWTASHYEPYPGYRPFPGALTEYNGKFMDNQRVLRGGSFATPRSHVRATYRNFWPADARFQFTGVRLVQSS